MGSLVFILVVIFIKGSQALSLKMLIQTPGGTVRLARRSGGLNAIPWLSQYWGSGDPGLALLVSVPISIVPEHLSTEDISGSPVGPFLF